MYSKNDMDYIARVSAAVEASAPDVAAIMKKEFERQNSTVNLIASENFVSTAVMAAAGSWLTNKYSEGMVAKRYYSGCGVVDEIELLCRKKWLEVFGVSDTYHVNVQPHSGSQANFAAYTAVLKPGDTVLSMSLSDGGHLTHGSPANNSGKLYNFVHYSVTDEGVIDYDDLERKLDECSPKLVVCGASSYSRTIDFARIRALVDAHNAESGDNTLLMADIAHIAGLVVAGYHPTPFGVCDIVTCTTHKTLRGARGGLTFCKLELAGAVDKAVFPGTQGGPLQHIIAAKCVTAEECLKPEYKDYIRRVVENCAIMAQEFISMGYKVVAGGTDNHLFMLDLTDTGVSGLAAQLELEKRGIILNRNCVPGEKRSAYETSGVRIGTAPETTRGFGPDDFLKVAHRIDEAIKYLASKE